MLYIGGDDDGDVKNRKQDSEESKVVCCHPGFLFKRRVGIEIFCQENPLGLN